MPRSYGLSLLLHIGLVLVMAFGFPILFEKKEAEIQPIVITLESLPVKPISNVKPSQSPLRNEPPKPPKPEPVTKPVKATPPPKQQEKEPEKAEPVPDKETDKPAPPKPEKTPPKPPKKIPDPKKNEKKAEPESDAFEDILKNMAKENETQKTEKEPVKDPKPASTKTTSDAPYDPSLPLSISEKDAIRGQFVKCWHVLAGARGGESLAVRVRVQVNQDGTVRDVGLVPDQVPRYQSDAFFKAAADSAIRAVRTCSPLKDLPMAKYETWKDMELNFDPKEML